jgi:hypothetical protein
MQRLLAVFDKISSPEATFRQIQLRLKTTPTCPDQQQGKRPETRSSELEAPTATIMVE